MKKIISALLAVLLSATMLSGIAMADGNSRIVFGKDLTDKQKTELLKYFGVEKDAVPTLEVSIDEEKAWLGKVLPAEKIGSRSLSSIYIKETAEGSGLNVETKNINWVIPEMYMAACMTAGIVDADIKIAAPTPVSGTAALVGICKAYEDITGAKLDPAAMNAAIEELVLTGNLGDYLGSEEATVLVNDLKKALDQVKGKSDDEIKDLIAQTAKDHNVSLTDGQVDQLVNLVKRLSELNIDPNLLLQQAKKLQDLTDKLNGIQQSADGIGGWFSSVWDGFTGWLRSIFG